MAKSLPKHRAIDPKGSGRHSADPAEPEKAAAPEKKGRAKAVVRGAERGGVIGGVVGGVVGSRSSRKSGLGISTSGHTGMKLLIAEFFICMVILGLAPLAGNAQPTQPPGPQQNTPAPQGPNQ